MASELTIKALAKLNIKGAPVTVSGDVIQSLSEVGKVTSANKFLRDALYRFAEMKASGTLNDDKDHETFREILKSATAYAEAIKLEQEKKQELVARYVELSAKPNTTDKQGLLLPDTTSTQRAEEIQALLKAIQY